MDSSSPPRGDSYDRLLEVAARAARRGGEVLRESFGDPSLEAEEKERNDFVSRVDRDSEAAIVGEILDAFPDHRVLAEEGGVLGDGDGDRHFQWIVDPLDGTSNYLRGLPYFCVSIACLHHDEEVVAVIYDPNRDEIFTAMAGRGAWLNGGSIDVAGSCRLDGAFLATGFPFKALPALEVYLAIFHELFLQARSIRRCGAAALDLAYTAAGVYDGFFEFRLQPWDLAAGALLVREAGGVVSDLDGGSSYLAGGNVLAASPALHAELIEVISHHTSERGMDELVPRTRISRSEPIGEI